MGTISQPSRNALDQAEIDRFSAVGSAASLTPRSSNTGMINMPPPPGPNSINPSAPIETAQGRIGQLLKTDQRGNYTNPVVRQAVDRQHQTFNARGLLNTSMAQQAGQEAAISKATDIATADAQMINDANERERERQFQDKTRLDDQDFQLRGDYQSAVGDINTNFQKMVDTVNASGMTPEDKSVAIAQAQQVRDGELAYQNNLFSRMPRWKNEWLAAAVPMAGMDVGTIGNMDTLANIVNDPAQTQAMRDAAAARLAALRSGAQAGGGAGAGGAAAGPTEQQQYEAWLNSGGGLPIEFWRAFGRPGPIEPVRGEA